MLGRFKQENSTVDISRKQVLSVAIEGSWYIKWHAPMGFEMLTFVYGENIVLRVHVKPGLILRSSNANGRWCLTT